MRPCKHVWTVVGRSYHPAGRSTIEKAWGSYGLALAERILTGWTDISLRCGTCGDVATKQVLGEWKESAA